MPVPWVWTRDKLAQAFGIRPWEIDSLPWYEIEVKLKLMELENEGRSRRQRKEAARANAQANKGKSGGRRVPRRRR